MTGLPCALEARGSKGGSPRRQHLQPPTLSHFYLTRSPFGISRRLADEEAGSGSLQKRAFGARPATDGAGQRAGQSPSVVATMTPLAVMAATFTMTFVAEWGDRSQIATIAMGAAKDPLGVCVGGVLGHALCTGLAVLGGKLLSTKISEKAVLIVGGVVFLAFGIHSVWAGPSA